MSATDRTVAAARYHGTGNDFILVDAREYVPDRASFAAAHCDRDRGVAPPVEGERPRSPEGDATPDRTDGGTVGWENGPEATTRTGADGVLFLALEDQYTPPRVVMTLVQPDGSTAAMCGNGARCAAAWAARRTDATAVMVDTQAGTRRARVRDGAVEIEMGVPSFDPANVPLARDAGLVDERVGDLAVTAVDAGVPHAVAFVDDVATVDLASVAPPIRDAAAFPEGANVTLASPRAGGGFDQRTYERGVEGETRSCGTGAVAVAAAARRLGRTEVDSIAVSPPGGDLTVTFTDCGRAHLRGPVAREFDVELPVTPPTAGQR